MLFPTTGVFPFELWSLGWNLLVCVVVAMVLLGVRRQGVTVALHDLESKGLIRSTRSHIRILDRDGLQAAANGFYGIPEAEYDRAIGYSPRRAPPGRPGFL